MNHLVGQIVAVLVPVGVAATLATPAYLIYWVWGLGRARLEGLNRWAAAGGPGRVELLDHAQLALGLVLWSWPLAAIVLAAEFRRQPSEHFDLLRLDGPGPLRRWWIELVTCRGGALAAFLSVFLVTLVSTAPFDLASIETYANVLRRIWAETAALEAGLIAAVPMMLLGLAAVVPAIVAWDRTLAPSRTLSGLGAASPAANAGAGGSTTSWRLAVTGSLLLLLMSVVAPAALLGADLQGLVDVRAFLRIESEVLLRGVAVAAVSGACLGFVTLALAAGWNQPSRWVRRGTSAVAVSWVWMGLLPPPTIGSLLVLAWNQPEWAWLHATVYQGPAMLVLGHLARFGLVAVVLARWLALSEPPALREMRVLDRATSVAGWLRARGLRATLGPVIAAAAFGTALGLSEVATTMVVTPAGWQSPAERLLNRMHYARESAVAVSSLMLMGAGLVLGGIAVMALRLAAPSARQ